MLYEALRRTPYAKEKTFETSVANTLKSLGYREEDEEWLACWWNGCLIDDVEKGKMKQDFAEGFRELAAMHIADPYGIWKRWLNFASDGNHSGKVFIPHPFGKNSCPDFILVNDNKVLPLEVKTSVTNIAPTFGATAPSADYLYLFSRSAVPANGRSGNMLFMGDDLITEYQREIIENCKAEVRRVIAEAKRKLNETDNLHGFTVNGRVKVEQLQYSGVAADGWGYYINSFHGHERADFLRENAKAHINQFEAGKAE